MYDARVAFAMTADQSDAVNGWIRERDIGQGGRYRFGQPHERMTAVLQHARYRCAD